MNAEPEDPERRRLRQHAQLAGSLAPPGMGTYAGKPGHWGRHWGRSTPAERRRLVLVLSGSLVLGAPGALLIFGVTSVYIVVALGAVLLTCLVTMIAMAVAQSRRSRP